MTAHPTSVRRAVLDDWYVDGRCSAVLVDMRVLVLSELATAILGLAGEQGCTMDHLGEELSRRFGSPVGTSSAVATSAAVQQLRDEGVLVVVGWADAAA